MTCIATSTSDKLFPCWQDKPDIQAAIADLGVWLNEHDAQIGLLLEGLKPDPRCEECRHLSEESERCVRTCEHFEADVPDQGHIPLDGWQIAQGSEHGHFEVYYKGELKGRCFWNLGDLMEVVKDHLRRK
jgi:hypothetical protein